MKGSFDFDRERFMILGFWPRWPRRTPAKPRPAEPPKPEPRRALTTDAMGRPMWRDLP